MPLDLSILPLDYHLALRVLLAIMLLLHLLLVTDVGPGHIRMEQLVCALVVHLVQLLLGSTLCLVLSAKLVLMSPSMGVLNALSVVPELILLLRELLFVYHAQLVLIRLVIRCTGPFHVHNVLWDSTPQQVHQFAQHVEMDMFQQLRLPVALHAQRDTLLFSRVHHVHNVL